MKDNATDLTHQPVFSIEELRFESNPGESISLWYDLSSPEFTDDALMRNLYSDFSHFLKYLSQQEPALYQSMIPDISVEESQILADMEDRGFDWEQHLHRYISNSVDLRAVEKERNAWAEDRKRREESSADSVRLPDLTVEDKPVFDDAIHAFVDSLNKAAIELYPEIMEYSETDINRLREILEAHGERLAIQVTALNNTVQKAKNNPG